MTQNAVYKSLKERYNGASGYGIVNKIVLPSSKTRVRMVTNDIAKVMQTLLTRPKNKAKDYLFYDQNSFKKGPQKTLSTLPTAILVGATVRPIMP